ncbi:MAG: hypothetical protein H7A45_06245 [Verrucomicrobiales bacterium]|nr:hypothetical protein [Verrucomicrobiales bacterium]
MVTGNAVVIKPASASPALTFEIARPWMKPGFPKAC